MSEDDNKLPAGQPPEPTQKASSSAPPPPPPPMMRTDSIDLSDEPLRAFRLDDDD